MTSGIWIWSRFLPAGNFFPGNCRPLLLWTIPVGFSPDCTKCFETPLGCDLALYKWKLTDWLIESCSIVAAANVVEVKPLFGAATLHSEPNGGFVVTSHQAPVSNQNLFSIAIHSHATFLISNTAARMILSCMLVLQRQKPPRRGAVLNTNCLPSWNIWIYVQSKSSLANGSSQAQIHHDGSTKIQN